MLNNDTSILRALTVLPNRVTYAVKLVVF